MPGKDGKDVIPTWSASEPPSDQMPGHVEPTPIPPPGSNYLAWIIVFVVVFVAGIAFVLLRNGDDGSDPQVAAPTTVFQDDSAPGGGISDDSPQDGGGASDPDDAVDPDAPPDAGGPTLTPSCKSILGPLPRPCIQPLSLSLRSGAGITSPADASNCASAE